MVFEVLQAEKTNLLRDGEPQTILGVSKSGDKPRPIRKRAFWRAYKRKELWAVHGMFERKHAEAMIEITNSVARDIFDPHCPANTAYLMWPMEGLSKCL